MRRIPTVLTLTAVVFLAASQAHAIQAELDPSFSDNGKVRFPRSLVSDLDDVTVHRGKVYASGVSMKSPQALVVLRLLRDGSPDPTFGDGGIARYRMPLQQGMTAKLDVAGDGSVAVVTQSRDQATLVRLDASGRVDAEFAGDGVRRWPAPAEQSFLPPLVKFDLSGRLVVSLMASRGAGSNLHVYRFQSGGQPDSNFSADGERTINLGTFDWNDAMTVDEKGRVLLGTDNLGGGVQAPPSGALIRLRTDGAYDGKFSGDGVTRFKLQPTGSTWPTGIGVTPKGRITVAVVNPDNAYGAVRIDSNGSLLRRFGDNGVLGLTCFCYAFTSDVSGGRVAITGFRNDGPALVVRLSRDGQGISQASFDVFPAFQREVVNGIAWSDTKLVLVGESDESSFAARVM